MKPKPATSDAEINDCYAVMAELRSHVPEDVFLKQVREMEREGYRLACLEDDNAVVAVAGYRIHTSLFMGKKMYVDDLVTAERLRSKGYGKIMMDWLRDHAKAEGCNYLHLDSGTQRHRAHRFYLNQGLDIACYNFSQKLD